MLIEQKVAQRLILKKKTLSLAESCTGGLLAHRITNVPGSSRFFKMGLILYSDKAKCVLLKIPSLLIKKHGAVSEEVAAAMARALKKKFPCDLGVSITGIAGPTGATKEKPIGLTFIGLYHKNRVFVQKCQFKGNRLNIKKQAATTALRLIMKVLS